jgi:enoyl-CoA hydratase/carnithine racemase
MNQNLRLERRGDVFILTLQKPPENRLTSQFCQVIIQALNDVRKELGPNAPGAVIIQGDDTKFFCTVRYSVLLKEVINSVSNSS